MFQIKLFFVYLPYNITHDYVFVGFPAVEILGTIVIDQHQQTQPVWYLTYLNRVIKHTCMHTLIITMTRQHFYA